MAVFQRELRYAKRSRVAGIAARPEAEIIIESGNVKLPVADLLCVTVRWWERATADCHYWQTTQE